MGGETLGPVKALPGWCHAFCHDKGLNLRIIRHPQLNIFHSKSLAMVSLLSNETLNYDTILGCHSFHLVTLYLLGIVNIVNMTG